jgi:hypothetical protein
MPRLRALTAWADRRQGDEFDASDDDARVLCARDLPGGQKAERIADRAMRPVEPPIEPPAEPRRDETSTTPAMSTNKRRYLRRDLRAQN